jgi:hypothetical protein
MKQDKTKRYQVCFLSTDDRTNNGKSSSMPFFSSGKQKNVYVI